MGEAFEYREAKSGLATHKHFPPGANAIFTFVKKSAKVILILMNTKYCEPLLKWAGGKRRLLDQICSFLPAEFQHYYEPFLGGGALFFAIQPQAATLSDTNQELIETYIAVRDNVEAVVRNLQNLQNSEDEYYRIRDAQPKSAAGKAAKFIYLCSLSFNGIYRQNLKGKFNVPYGHKLHLNPCDEKRLRRTSMALKGRSLITSDFEAAVKNARKGDLVYFDPPYTVTHGNNGFVKYNAKIFSWADQVRLAAVAIKLKNKGCSVLVSNADHPSIQGLYPGFRTFRLERHSIMAASARFRGQVTESLFF